MHQPYYKNPLTNSYEMPWVFLHGIKDYYEMPWHLINFKRVKVNFNLVPSLLKQLKDYEDFNVNCKLMNVLRKKVSELTEDEKNSFLDLAFSPNPKSMIHPYPRYFELYNKYSKKGSKAFSNQEILDVEVLFLLSWTGVSLRKSSKYIQLLLEKGLDYSEEEKIKLIEELILYIKEIVPIYKTLYKEGKIGLSVSPFYHPIIPLLLDINSARESVKDIKLPKLDVDFKDDAIVHIERGIQYFNKNFDFNVNAVWSSEGSVSTEALKIYSRYFNVITTDEDILFNTLGNRNKVNLYKRYKFQNGEENYLNILFRDKELSDLIGFVYSQWKTEDAVDDFIDRIKNICNQLDFNPIIPVILDGENAWEYYSNNGYNFLQAFYSRLEQEEWIETVRFEDIEQIPVYEERLDKVVAGSWIGGNFLTWIGDEEKNKAWEVLGQTKAVLKGKNITSGDILEHLYIAEGSDWFWWYGDTHHTKFAYEFDILFRSNLVYIYKKLGMEIPKSLEKPIKRESEKLYIQPPKNYIQPVIDGEITSYFEWLNAGVVNLRFDLSSMDTSKIYLENLNYGYDKEYIYILLEGELNDILDKGYKLDIEFNYEDKKKNINLELSRGKSFIKITANGCDGITYSINHVIEIKIPKTCLEFKERIEILFKILDGEKLIQKIPLYNSISLDLSKNFDREWYV